jgi:hypothetical protein
MMKNPVRKIFRAMNLIICLLLVAGGLSGSPGYGQSGAGSIQGTVKDSTGAVIRGAHIHVVKNSTHQTSDTVSNGAGFYQVPELFTDTYTMTVTAPGMETYKTSIELQVAQNAVINPAMAAGSVSQTVEVNANAIQLTTPDSATIESTLENARIKQLPENGRQLTQLLNLTTPGLENTGANLNGLDPEALDYVVDGATTKSNNAGGVPQSKTLLLDPDAVQEVRVKASNSGAQFATPGTAIVSTKSGTNKIHGTFFETARNNAFGIARQEEDPVGQAAPEYIRNEFGLSVGGPVVIPHFYNGHNKTFWFFAYERYSLAQKNSVRTAVPTLAMRQGDFSGLIPKSGVLQTIYDPSTTFSTTKCPYTPQNPNNPYCRKPFPNNTIPLSEESPFAKIYYQLVPEPNTADNPLINGNYVGAVPIYQVAPQETARLDHVFNESNRGYIRFTDQQSGVNITGGVQNVAISGIPAGAALGYNNNPSQSLAAALGYTHIFSSTFVSETIVSQQWFQQSMIPGVDPGVDYESMLGLPNNFGEVGFPNVTGLITNLASSQTGNARQSQINFIFDENLTKVKGRHQLLFGGRFRYSRNGNHVNGLADAINYGVNPVAVYDPGSKKNYTGLANTGDADASFFLGSAGSYKINLEAPPVHYRTFGAALYLQDNFHVNSNLTLNVGLRYEAHPATYTHDGLMNSFDLKNDAVVLASTPQQLIAKGYTTQAIITNDENIGMKFETPAEAGFPNNTLLNSYDWIFLPRLGVAWTPWGPNRLVLRGGYGIYTYDTPLENYVNHPEGNNPFTATYTQSYSTAAQAIDGLPNEQIRYNGPAVFGVTGLNTTNIVNTSTTTSILPGVTLWSDSPDWRPVHVQQGNVTLEQPLPGRSAVRVSWIYSKSTDLDIADSYNSSPANYEWEAATGTVPPTGGTNVIGTPLQNTYSVTATGPYDQTTYGANTYHTKDGWANYNALQVNYQRLFHRGSAYQISYVYAKAMRAGGDVGGGNADSTVFPDANYPGVLGTQGIVTLPYGTPYAGNTPPPRPAALPAWADWHAMDRFQLYQLDTSTPKLHVKFNGIYDIPIGRGKRFFPKTKRWVNEIIGGFQIAGNGSIVSQVFQPGTGNDGPISPLHVYKKKYKITDCSSGVCRKEFLWWNGYISPLVNANTGFCTSNCISGIPATYTPFQTPVDNDPTSTNFNTQKVNVQLLDGTVANIAYNPGPNAANYTGKTFLNGPINWTADASIFKVFPIREGMLLRVNLDAFNVFNMPGENNPGADGIERYLNSHNASRQLQITARFTF